MNKLFNVFKEYGRWLSDRQTESRKAIVTQDPSESDFVKGFNRGEAAAYDRAYSHFKTLLLVLTK